MNKLKEFKAKLKKNNKGFSLVELIVVIVILAILIGVTIGGIYQYVNKSRVNTDINNAASIQSVIATIATDENVDKAITTPDTGKIASYYIKWNTSGKITTTATEGAEYEIVNRVNEILTDDFPKAQSNSTFEIGIIKDDKGNISATCKVYASHASDIAPTFSTTSINADGKLKPLKSK